MAFRCIHIATPLILFFSLVLLIFFFFFFFFSSRRRHTRFDCDWSSDVCSSDLSRQGCTLADLRERFGCARGCALCLPYIQAMLQTGRTTFDVGERPQARSEERRVGKECRSRWWRYH